ncbi:MAG: TIGR02206 family membrane protein [Bacteroidota bacterium]|nr:TIGR02206 family membrane protein [Bacteroidota bacterium]
MTKGFHSFSFEHFGALAILVLLTFGAIYFGRRGGDITKGRIGFGIAMASFGVLWIDLIYRLISDTLRISDDLPLFLCDLVACLLPFFIYKRNRTWMGVLYFWSIAGTAQALLTPDLKEGFPSFEYLRYFIMHGCIVAAVIYYVVVWRLRMDWIDFLRAIVYVQVYLICIHLFNLVIGTNYSYTLAKPAGPTALDLMGEWPVYILTAELLMVVLFLLLMLPFLKSRARG